MLGGNYHLAGRWSEAAGSLNNSEKACDRGQCDEDMADTPKDSPKTLKHGSTLGTWDQDGCAVTHPVERNCPKRFGGTARCYAVRPGAAIAALVLEVLEESAGFESVGAESPDEESVDEEDVEDDAFKLA